MSRPTDAIRANPNRESYSGRGRPSKPLVTKQSVIDAALDLIDENGRDALNMRQLANRLGLDAVSSLYNHFKNKTEIEAAVARRVVSDMPGPDADVTGPTWMLQGILTYRDALVAHPNAIGLVVDSAPRNFATAMFRRAAKEMTASGVDPDNVLALLDALESVAVGSAVASAAASADTVPFEEVLGEAKDLVKLDERQRFELACRVLIEGMYAKI